MSSEKAISEPNGLAFQPDRKRGHGLASNQTINPLSQVLVSQGLKVGDTEFESVTSAV